MSMNERLLPSTCPSCGQLLRVERLCCRDCATAVEGDFVLPLLARLSSEEMGLVLNLVKASGSLKDLARVYSVSYPTIRNRLDALIERLTCLELEAGREQGEVRDGSESE